jgi:hypothetical protein
MAYTPPGVYTEVEIANNIVQLPGGTRILALIGNGRSYKCIAGEAVVQSGTRIESLLKSPILSVSSVYDFTNPGGGIKEYPASGDSTYFDSGYAVVNDQLVWSPAVNPYPVSTTPAIGATYYVTYSGTGASGTTAGYVTDTLVQVSGYENVLSSGTGTYTIQGVSGVGITYYSGGSTQNTGTDSSGYSKAGSGWNQSASGTITWSQATGIAYPSASVPPVSGTFFVDYCYTKGADDYKVLSFTEYTSVVNEYGPDAEFNQITEGPLAGGYEFDHINSLTLGAREAFANGASVVSLVQLSGDATAPGAFTEPLNKLQGKTVDVIVPLTLGSGASLTEVSLADKSTILTAVKIHCDTMSLPQNKKERVAIGSLGQAEIGDSSTVNTYIYEASVVQHDKRMTLTAPGVCTIEVQDPNGEFHDVDLDGSLLSVGMGALSCNPNLDVATPLTNKQLLGYIGTSATTTNHANDEYLQSEMNQLAAAGVCVIDQAGSKIFIRHQLTTDQTNVAVGEFSVVTTTDYVSQAVRYTTEQFIGQKLINSIVVPAVKSTISATMQALVAAQIINAIGVINVQINPNNPTELLSTVQYVPVFPLNRIKVTFTIRTQL